MVCNHAPQSVPNLYPLKQGKNWESERAPMAQIIGTRLYNHRVGVHDAFRGTMGMASLPREDRTEKPAGRAVSIEVKLERCVLCRLNNLF